ncbi:MAG TPA: EAL domain-containing protein, partial [Mesorhizobium sp.]|nr:EAL domain-containing protein [Mesorhizobium sp.]
EQLRRLGIDLEIDDFGTGHASIVSLLKLQPRRLKVARQLVEPVTTSKKQRQLVASLIEIGNSLGIDVVAEGVETMEHAMIMRSLGCDVLQGYALARPMNAQAFESFVLTQGWRVAS